jgi:radical SAM protein with 4Fe4S-binding SPASM domain
MDSQKSFCDDLSFSEIVNVLDKFARMGVFQVALGGGEAFERQDFGEIVEYCNSIGLVANITTNGAKIGSNEVNICKKMGQVNISIDGIDSLYSCNGRNGLFQNADKALKTFKNNGIQAGINCVVSCKNYSHLEEIVAYAAAIKVNEIEFLKFKPFGKGKNRYHEYALTQEMIRSFYPTLKRLAKKYPVELKIDCSFIPSMVFHKPPKDELEMLAVTGCDGGNILLAVRNNGCFSGCSFIENSESVFDLESKWHNSQHLKNFRELTTNAQEPCRSCNYLSICRCGCRVVSLYRYNDFFAPDPECPVVFEYKNQRKEDEKKNPITQRCTEN